MTNSSWRTTMNGFGEVKMKLWKRLIDYSAQTIAMCPSLQNHSDPALSEWRSKSRCKSAVSLVEVQRFCLISCKRLVSNPIFFSKREGWRNALSPSLSLSFSEFENGPVKTARTHRNLQVLKLCANLSAGIGNGIPTQTGLITL